MDPLKKRKLDENGVVPTTTTDTTDTTGPHKLTVEDARKLIEPFTHEQLLEIVQTTAVSNRDVLDLVRSIADRDSSQRKLFIRGLGWDTTTEKLRALFSTYGELSEAVVILDKATGKSKGYGFITFLHVDGALLALKEPSKKIDGRMTVTQLASAGNSGGGPAIGLTGGFSSNLGGDVANRKVYVANVPYEMAADRLLAHFAMYGEIEEGPLGFDKATGKSKGYTMFVYKTAEAARASLVDPVKNIDGHQLSCKFANDGKKGKVGPSGVQTPVGMVPGEVQPGSQFGGPGGVGGYGGYLGGVQGQLGQHTHMNSTLGGPGLASVGSQGQSNLGGVSGGFGSGLGGPYSGSHYSGIGSSGFGGLGGTGGGALGGAAGGLGGVGSGYNAVVGGGGGGLSGVGGGGFGGVGGGGMTGVCGGGLTAGGGGGGLGGAGGGLGGTGRGSSFASGDYSAHYSLSSSSGYQGQQNQLTGASPGPRVPSGGLYHGVPPYY